MKRGSEMVRARCLSLNDIALLLRPVKEIWLRGFEHKNNLTFQ